MTTADAVRWLQSDNDDLVIVRVSGSVRVKKLRPELQGTVTADTSMDMVAAALSAAEPQPADIPGPPADSPKGNS